MFTLNDDYTLAIAATAPFKTEYNCGGVLVCNDDETTITVTVMTTQSARVSIAAIVSHCNAPCVAATFCTDHATFDCNAPATLAELNAFVVAQFPEGYLR